MDSFLKQVAQFLFSEFENKFDEIKLILPNRRSGVFLQKHIQDLNTKTIWLPQTLTINDFLEEHTQLKKGENIQLLAILYKSYIQISKSNESFDEFYFWGEIILNDFNDVDKYLINTEAIFSNIKALKSIDSGFDYLSEDQKEVLKRFFSEFDPNKNSKLKENFLEIWNHLLPLYNLFNQELKKAGLAYEGMIYKDAVNQIKKTAFENNETKYFFIGFNAITKCEEEIFNHIQKHKSAFFFWDFDDYYIKNKLFEAGFFLRNYLIKFPPPKGFSLKADNLLTNKNISTASTPTNDGQMYFAGKHLNKNPQEDYSNTALVLADETLLGSALYYLPKNINDINITMGYPVKDTLAGSFIEQIITLKLNSSENNQLHYHKHVLPLIKHPYITTVEPQKSKEISWKIISERLINLKPKDIDPHELFDLIFSPATNYNTFSEQLSKILEYIQERLAPMVDDSKFQLDFEILFNIYLTVNQLQSQLNEQKLELSLPIYFRLLRKMLIGLRIPFEGEPVKGLQIMGFLETRNLDFENIIILSANDSQLPASSNSPSFIPHGLRKGFSLPTRELHDAMYAYYFYRIIQRAKNISLVYNSSVGGLSTGEKSRFIHQIQYDNNFTTTELSENYTIDMMVRKSVELQKNNTIKKQLSTYLDGANPRLLSPSAIVTYLTCPLKFYYQNILRLRDEDELSESVDARLFGNIFHHAAEFIYEPLNHPTKQINKSDIENLINNKEIINSTIHKAFTKTFLGKNPKRAFSIKGKNTLIFEIIKKYLIKMLRIDLQYTPFNIIGLEDTLSRPIKITTNGQKMSIKIGGQIDRLDRTSEGLRIIDYKTGSDNLTFKTLDDVFDREKINTRKAILQTFIYSYVCAGKYPNETAIIPGIYKVKDLFKKEFNYKITSTKEPAFESSNYLKIEERVTEYLQTILTEIFDDQTPFTQTSDEERCKYCNYKTMCGR